MNRVGPRTPDCRRDRRRLIAHVVKRVDVVMGVPVAVDHEVALPHCNQQATDCGGDAAQAVGCGGVGYGVDGG